MRKMDILGEYTMITVNKSTAENQSQEQLTRMAACALRNQSHTEDHSLDSVGIRQTGLYPWPNRRYSQFPNYDGS